MEVDIRKASFEDYESINKLHCGVNDMNASFAPFILKHADYSLKNDLFEKMILSEKDFVFVATRNKLIIGFLIAEIKQNQNK